MTGLDDDEFGPEDFRPAPHPDDRLWRHPAEVAAMRAAEAAAAEAPTVELPKVVAASAPASSRQQRRMLAAALVVLLGASAAAVGVISARSANEVTDRLAASQAGLASIPAGANDRTGPSGLPTESASPGAGGSADGVALTGRVEPNADGALAERLHADLAASMPRIQAATATGMREGSGFFVTNDGHLVTSAALVEGSDYLLVWTDDGSRWHAEVAALDPFSDVAVLEVIDAPPSEPVLFKADQELWTGQYAMAIDHRGASMTVGEVASLTGAAATGAPGDPSSRFRIAPGMEPGAAIVDDSGAVIGLVNAGTDASQATPGWMVEQVTIDLLTVGTTDHAWLGVQAEPTDDGHASLLTTILGDSPAARAGLRAGDIVDSVDGEAISSTQSLWTLVQRHEPGDVVDLAVTRNGQRRLITVELSATGG